MSATLWLLLLTGCATLGLSRVAFSKPHDRSQGGDAIIVESVSASSFPLQRGDRVLVRGRYSLQTRPSAILSLYHAQDGSAERFPPTRRQQADTQFRRTQDIAGGSGSFELECIANSGSTFQLSLIDVQARDTFGTAIFKLEAPSS